MSDGCKSKTLNGVGVQENGIIRTHEGIIIGRLSDGVDFDSPVLADPETVSVAMSILKKAMADDPGYAHGWHCNIAMSCLDSFGTELAIDHGSKHEVSNEAASRFMKLCFGVETTQ